MKKILTLCILSGVMLSASSWSESILKPLNEKGYGTVSGRIQSLSMYRDFDGVGNGANTTLGFVLNYTSPEFSGFDAGLGYNYAGEIYDNNLSAILANDDIHLLNEGWVRYNFGSLDLTNTTITVGRKINHAEVFRADDFRQKSRGISAVQAESTDVHNFRFAGGHAVKMSNWIQAGDRWEYNNFGDVFGKTYDTAGITWAEAQYTGVKSLDAALFNATAWDVSNMLGARAEYSITEKTGLLAYLRFERDIGKATDRDSNAFGLSAAQKLGAVALEGGYFGVSGDDLVFQETTTGINHALGASMMLYSGQFNGDSDTLYVKATTKLDGAKTILYALYNYTWNDKAVFDGQELNLVAKQPIIENLSVAVKYGIGQREYNSGNSTTAQDARLFLTYAF